MRDELAGVEEPADLAEDDDFDELPHPAAATASALSATAKNLDVKRLQRRFRSAASECRYIIKCSPEQPPSSTRLLQFRKELGKPVGDGPLNGGSVPERMIAWHPNNGPAGSVGWHPERVAFSLHHEHRETNRVELCQAAVCGVIGPPGRVQRES
ncbi:MAG: hypothetical protein QOI68_5832 [Pseudonocardiales bacterium]|nr:hypothetical protein [Pseudonocardiales bacterium]